MPYESVFNGPPFNESPFNGGQYSTTQYSTDTLVFENFSLSDGSTMIMTDLKISGPSRDVVSSNVPRDHGKILTASYFREYTITAEGIVKKSTAATLDAYLDTIRSSLSKAEGNLDYTDENGTVKRFIATLTSYDDLFSGREGYHITFCPWKAVFKCLEPFGKSRGYSVQTESFTTSPTTMTIVNSGTTEAEPVGVLIFDAASSVTVVNGKRLDSNGDTVEEIEYSGSIATGDVLEFDSETKEVRKNGSAVDYTGGFLKLAVGSNRIKWTVTGTSFTCIATVKHKSRYL